MLQHKEENMENNSILGVHHITGITANVQRNYHFYTKVLALRLVKKTVRLDDPGAYHLYYGNAEGCAGTVLSFFPWEGLRSGFSASAMASEIGFSVPAGSLPFWAKRFKQYQVKYSKAATRFGEAYLSCYDPDGLQVNLVAAAADSRVPWQTSEVNADAAIRGLNDVTLAVPDVQQLSSVITALLGYTSAAQEGSRHRFRTNAIQEAAVVDLVELPSRKNGRTPAINYHVAFRVKDESVLMAYREKIIAAGLSITEKIDSNYFYSLYFREPGGVLFELATDNPGFAMDETVKKLGSYLQLPEQYEPLRAEIENALPALA